MYSKDFWNERYGRADYVYGTAPNRYLKEKFASLPKGRVLMPSEGEGRNAVYLAKLGWDVSAFDQSSSAWKKANALAEHNCVVIEYVISDVAHVSYDEASFDALVMIYAHYEGHLRREFHQKLLRYLKPGGILLFEGFAKGHAALQSVNPSAGGPRDSRMLYDLEELLVDFSTVEMEEAYEMEMDEGSSHQGSSKLVRLFGRKKGN